MMSDNSNPSWANGDAAPLATQILIGLRDELVERGYVVKEEWSSWSPVKVCWKLSLLEIGYEIFLVGNGSTYDVSGMQPCDSSMLMTVRDLFMKKPGAALDYHDKHAVGGIPSVVLSVALEDPKCFERLFEILRRRL